MDHRRLRERQVHDRRVEADQCGGADEPAHQQQPRARPERAAAKLRARGLSGVAMALATGLLVRLPNYVGDAVCALPALQALATRGALLALGPSWAVPLLAAAGLAARPYPRGLRARVGVLRATAQDAGTRRILLLTHSFSSALEARLAGLAPIGFAKDGRRLLLARSAGRLPGGHLVEDYAHLARVADAPVDVSMAAWTPTWPGPSSFPSGAGRGSRQ